MAIFDVLLPVKNGITYLAEALDSILRQTFRDWRLIILDHGSSDGSLSLVQQYAEEDPRIIARSFPQAHGLSGLLNAGLALCDCRYVLRQDADDVSLPQRMEILAAAFEADRDLVVAGSLAEIIDANGRKIGDMKLPRSSSGIAAAALFRNPIAHPAVAMRLESLRRLGASYGEDFMGAVPAERRLQVSGLAEDYFLFGQLAFLAPCLNVNRSLIKYRWHGGNVALTKYVDQMQVSVSISRYLAESLAIMHGAPYVDPAPFCNHSDALFDIAGREDFSTEYESLALLLRKCMPHSPERERELAFRKVISQRARATMIRRFSAFALRHSAELCELRTVKSWLLRGITKRAVVTVEPAPRTPGLDGMPATVK